MELEKKTLFRIGAGALILLIALVAFLIKGGLSAQDDISVVSETPAQTAENEEGIAREMEDDAGSEQEELPPIIVDVGGAVKNPGIASLKAGSRVYEAVAKAGGLCEDADPLYVNMAGFLTDGEKIYIPKIGEIKKEEGQMSAVSGSAPAGARIPGLTGEGTESAGPVASDGKINLNTATSDQLQTLNGVGPATAQKILDYRTQNGGFKKIDDLKNVSGIGDKTYEKFKDKICI